MALLPLNPSFDAAEIRAAESFLVKTLEDPDASKRVYAYTEDATFVAPGAPAVQGREERTTTPRTDCGATFVRCNHAVCDRGQWQPRLCLWTVLLRQRPHDLERWRVDRNAVSDRLAQRD